MTEVERISFLLGCSHPASPVFKEKKAAEQPKCSLNNLQIGQIPYELQVDRVIFNPPATIVYWKDGTKTMVKCYQDEFCEDIGFAMACVRKLYGTRGAFKAQYKNAYRPYLKPKKQKKEKPAKQPNINGSEAKTYKFTMIPKSGGESVVTLDQMMKQVAGEDSMGVVLGVRVKND